MLADWWSRVRAKARGKTRPGGSPSLEPLEPRVLLSADLLGTEPPAPAVLCLGERAIYVDLDEQDAQIPETDSSAILTYLASPSPSTEPEVEVAGTPANATVAHVERGSEPSAAALHDDSICPADTSALSVTTYAKDEGSIASIEGEGSSLVAPEIPGMQLADPDLSSWQGQIIYLDFDGERNVIYDGPVTVGPFGIPAFGAPGDLAGREQIVIEEALGELGQIFAGSGIIFTTQRPAGGADYSTIYIGGDDSAFSRYGTFIGLAEQVDVGNEDRRDEGFVFSDRLDEQVGGTESFASRLAWVISHEVGHLLGFAHRCEAQRDTCGLSSVSYMQGDAPLFEDSYVHQWITQQAYNFYESQFGSSELEAYLGVVDDRDYGNRYVIEGSCDEDRGSTCPWGDEKPGNGFDDAQGHYWAHKADFTRVYDDGYSGDDSAVNRAYKYFTGGIGLTGLYDDGWGTNANREEGIIYQYATGAKETAYYWLGHVAHLLEDMTLPAHAHADPHGLDDFWNMLDEYERYTAEGSNWQQWGFPVIGGMRGGPDGDIRTPQEIEDSIASGYGALYDLFYETASLADDFDSDDADGQVQAGAMRNGGITDAEARAVGDAMMTRAMKAVAELFRLFYSLVDGASPPSVILYDISGDENSPSLRSGVFQVTASGADAMSGVDLDGYHFVTWRWNGSSWGAAADWGACAGAKSIGPFSGGLYRIEANVENGAGDVGRSDCGYFYVEETSPVPYTIGDMNWDGYVSIVGDVPVFVRVTYFGDYDWYEQQFPGKNPALPGDCNGDGVLSLIGDVPGFVDRVYFGSDVAVLKPNIYLYPDVTTEMDVRIEFPVGGRVTASSPAYRDGWRLTVEPTGTINGQYDYLFYESSQPDYGQYERGWVIAQEELGDFFRENLAITGFRGREIDDFIEYWLPRLIDQPSYAIYPQYDEQIGEAVRLEFSIRPDNVIRLVYAIRGLGNSNLALLEPVIPPFTRSGFIVAEWGVILT
ncbi:MAG: LEPR-XLL domain-containing protein [Sedimentisphaerales bacterium]|nr:LEPR-XLL domain-containing protein [Sedimentisphaerales bacterium]